MEQNQKNHNFDNELTVNQPPTFTQLEDLSIRLKLPASVKTGRVASPNLGWVGLYLAVALALEMLLLWKEVGAIAMVILGILVLAAGRFIYSVQRTSTYNRERREYNQFKDDIPVWSRYEGDPTVNQRVAFVKTMLKIAENEFNVEVIRYIQEDAEYRFENRQEFEYRVVVDYKNRNTIKHTDFLSLHWKENDPEASRIIYEERILGQLPVQDIAEDLLISVFRNIRTRLTKKAS